jgi:uncharacterized protein YceH (UPF0502 family)
MSELDRLTRELVKQMVGRNVDDEQDGDYQIAYHYLSKAMKLSEQDLNARIAELEWEVSGLKEEIKNL